MTGSVNAPVPAFAIPFPSIIDPDQSTVTVLENVAILYLRFVSTIFVLITIRSNREPRTRELRTAKP